MPRTKIISGKGFEIVNFASLPSNFTPHFHDYWLVGCLRGASRSTCLKDGRFSLTDGDLFLLNPGEIHACSALQKGGIWQALHIHVEFTANLNEFAGFCCHKLVSQALLKDFLNLVAAADRAPIREGGRAAVENFINNIAEESRYKRTCFAKKTFKPDFMGFSLEGGQTPTLSELALTANMGKHHFARQFKAQNGISPHRYMVNRRLNLARELLAKGMAPVEAALHTGFYDQAHFSKSFKAYMGFTPGQFQTAVMNPVKDERK